jgi:serine/threonine protein phosphatase 1
MLVSLAQRLSNSLRSKGADGRPHVPEGAQVWAIGDMHGRADLLKALTDHILEDAEGAPVRSDLTVIGLGDYVDRGPDSKAVISQLIALAHSAATTRFLMGNHEEAMLTFLHDPAIGPTWCEFGGRETLWSYGVEPPSRSATDADWAQASKALGAALPADHRAFLESLEICCEIGDYFFVHAGVRPGVPLDQQSQRDMLWIRQEFLDHAGRWPKVIVHGHTPTETVVVTPARIGIDTGAYATSVLSALRLEGATRATAAARLNAGRIQVSRAPL